MRGLKRHVTCISLLLLSFIGCSPQTPPEPVERPVQRFIDPSVHLPEWDWTRKEKIRVLNPEGSGQEYPPNLVQLDKLWRKAFVLNPGQTFSESLNTGGSGTFEFSSMGARKAGMEGDYRMFLDVAVASAGNRIERRYEVPVTESTSIKWLDMSIPVPRMTDPVTWTISVTCDPAPESMGTIHAFIATPVFVPDTVEKKPHVILLAYDSMRADALGAYGSP
nr:hypothetical protein [bacterium]